MSTDFVANPMYESTYLDMILTRPGHSIQCEKYCWICGSKELISTKKYKTNNPVALIRTTRCLVDRKCETFMHNFHETVGKMLDRQQFMMDTYEFEDLTDKATMCKVHQTFLQILILSKDSIKLLKDQSETMKRVHPINRILRPKALLILVNMTKSDISTHFESVIPMFTSWNVFEMKYEDDTTTKRIDSTKIEDHIFKVFEVTPPISNKISIIPDILSSTNHTLAIIFKEHVSISNSVDILITDRMWQNIFVQKKQLLNPFVVWMDIPRTMFDVEGKTYFISVYIKGVKIDEKELIFNNDINQIKSEDLKGTCSKIKVPPIFKGVVNCYERDRGELQLKYLTTTQSCFESLHPIFEETF